MKKLTSTLLAAIMLILALASIPAQAASWPATSGIQTYVLSTKNDTIVYKTATSTEKYGTIYATDLITIKGYSGSRLKVTYPISGGTKTGYIESSKVTSSKINVSKSSYTATAKTTTYRRASTSATLGYISKGDKVYVIVEKSDGWKQVIYPISNGYKMGWIKTSTISKESSQTTSKKSLADVAAAEIGTKGVDKNGNYPGDYTKYGKWIGNDGVQWCASFVSWCANQAGVSTKIVPKTSSCTTMKNNSNSYHAWSSSALKSLKKNDVIFFANSAKGTSDHVGIVYSVSGSNITVIEGNTGSYYGPDIVKKITYTVDSSSGKITKGYNGKYFCGYISVS